MPWRFGWRRGERRPLSLRPSAAMDTLDFIAEIIRAVAWPVAVVVLVLLLRESLAKVLSRPGLRELRAGPSGIEAIWNETLTEASVELKSAGPVATQLRESAQEARLADLEAIVDDQPAAAIMEAFARVERSLVERMRSATDEETPKVGARALVRHALERGAITDETAKAIEGLTVLRNLAAHGGGTVSRTRGRQFLALADAVLYSLTREPGE